MNDGQDPGTVGVPSGDDEPMLLSTDKKDHVAEIKGPTCWNYTWKPSLASSATKSANTNTDIVSIIKAGNIADYKINISIIDLMNFGIQEMADFALSAT